MHRAMISISSHRRDSSSVDAHFGKPCRRFRNMSTPNTCLCMLSWDGVWKKEGPMDTMIYVGGQSNVLHFSTYQTLRDRIHASLNVDATCFDIQMAMHTTYGPNKLFGRLADIVDDSDIAGFVEFCRWNKPDVMPLYVSMTPRTSIAEVRRPIVAEVRRPSVAEVRRPIVAEVRRPIVAELWPQNVAKVEATRISSCVPNIAIETRAPAKHVMNPYTQSPLGLDDIILDHNCGYENVVNGDDQGYGNGCDNDDHGYDNDYNGYDNDDHVYDNDDRQRSVSEPSIDNVQPSLNEIDDEARMRRRTDPFRYVPQVPEEGDILMKTTESSGDGGLKAHDMFKSKRELQDALGRYSIDNMFEWKVHRSTKSLFEVRCKNVDTCKWQARGGVILGSDMFML
ncbi:uncharacterized protein [Euphorbia lathyris]|uniref:uncharacterized protein n=1 Tax=Euphorbia lathyris TaxID=212925 RepID=UPI0033138106